MAMNASLIIQVHKDAVSASSDAALDAIVHAIKLHLGSDKCRVIRASDDEWINVEIDSKDPVSLWREIENIWLPRGASGESLRQKWIVVCRGEMQWDDYKILAHFDPSVPLG